MKYLAEEDEQHVAEDFQQAPPGAPPVRISAGLAVVALRSLTRRERVHINGHGSYTKDFHYLQYQTSDGKWHDTPDVFEDASNQDS